MQQEKEKGKGYISIGTAEKQEEKLRLPLVYHHNAYVRTNPWIKVLNHSSLRFRPDLSDYC